MKSRWRAAAAPIVARVLSENAGRPEREVRRALTAAYPFGQRVGWPYKAWLAEVRGQIPRDWQRPTIDDCLGGLFAGEEDPDAPPPNG